MTTKQRLDRLNWCRANRNGRWLNYIWLDETACWINEAPSYHWRQTGLHPQTVGFLSSLRQKLNLWGGISWFGPTPFAVR